MVVVHGVAELEALPLPHTNLSNIVGDHAGEVNHGEHSKHFPVFLALRWDHVERLAAYHLRSPLCNSHQERRVVNYRLL